MRSPPAFLRSWWSAHPEHCQGGHQCPASLWLRRPWLTLRPPSAPTWRDPDAGQVSFGEYAAAWIEERGLTTRTTELYRSLLRLHLAPTFGGVAVADISPAAVRR
ncbi:hypothetical protein [Streptomyces meridianus]|uniref:Core-binding (CB) domain-containing protein n=1 Tax=Streptomyces meridianus TaxID=2938945 RepID=A0ABT0X0B7_9ACTN|nr:hypothetical protein [Streptomyces meridianus]MCM2576006.1 hypothetical protein [Streptomyces meridianus]